MLSIVRANWTDVSRGIVTQAMSNQFVFAPETAPLGTARAARH